MTTTTRTLLGVLACLAAALPAACSGGPTRASDEPGEDPPASPTAPAAPMPTAVPAAAGPVTTRNLAIVMDRGDGGPPELCLGPVAESWPPQCGGPALVGWDWADHEGFERQGGVRWGRYSVTGTWDGQRLTLERAVPAALHSPPVTPEPTPEPPATAYSPSELEAIALEVGSGLGGAQGAYAAEGRVLVDVTYDDGSLQAWTDERYGEGVVVVTPALVDVG